MPHSSTEQINICNSFFFKNLLKFVLFLFQEKTDLESYCLEAVFA